jgi:hypothetical protein
MTAAQVSGQGTRIDPDLFRRAWAADGVPLRVLAQMMGVSPSAVSQRARTLALPPRRPGHKVRYDRALLAEMWRAGVCAREIAAHFGLQTRGGVYRIVHDEGLPRRQRQAGLRPGRRTGGWAPAITVAEFLERRAAARMAAVARREVAELREWWRE